jgi:hypothetical protein
MIIDTPSEDRLMPTEESRDDCATYRAAQS